MIREIIRLVVGKGKSTRDCADALRVSKSTAAEYVQKFKRNTLTLEDLSRLTDKDLVINRPTGAIIEVEVLWRY